MNAELQTKVAIVTGGTRGIGLAITKVLREQGYHVAAFYHGNEDAAKECAQSTGASVYKVDVTDYEACQKGVMLVREDLGPISVLVNNAGITRDKVLHKMDKADWDAVIATNLTSCWAMCQLVIGEMRERGMGRIINISSINGQKGQFGQTNYSAAKAGMIGFTKALALESAAKGITVNAIAPGYIETDMTAAMNELTLNAIVGQIPAGRMGKVDEISSLVAYLCSDQAAFINGATIPVNGAQYLS
ncbi:MAG: acetoacetyl-CoA reductase [Pseudobdellovibrionaceae bacterium]